MYNNHTAAAMLGCSMIGWSGASLAADPPNAQLLGITESIVGYCARVDAPAAEKMKERIRQITQGASLEALAKIRETEEYRQGFDSVTEMVSKASPPHEAQPCSDALAAMEH
jgi:hypothetical protein